MLIRSNSIPMRVTTTATTATNQSYHGFADIVIIGNGIAGLTAAIEARRLAPARSIVIISDQCHPTIHTPALKQYTVGKLEREQLLAYPAGTERARNIQLVHARVEAIDASNKCIHLSYGGGIGYDALLIATGSMANGLPAHLPGRDFDGVLTLHCLHHYLDLRRRLYQAGEVDEAVVIGAGVHAVETVASLLQMGIQTHWLLRGETCLSHVLDTRASERVLQHMRRAGARVYTETEVPGIAGHVGAVVGVITNQHQFLPCQLVLVCTGSTPATLLAQRCSVPMLYEQARGIFVNNQLRTSVPGIYAAGDVAAIRNPLTGVYEARAQWHAAVVQGCLAAAAMTGQGNDALPSFGVPWHATRVGELSLLTVGEPSGRLEGVVTLTDNSRGGYRRLSLIDDRLVGYLALGPSQADGLAIKRLIDEGYSVRSIKNALLKGTFDARTFFAQQHSFAVLSMATSGRLLAVKAFVGASRALRNS
jgi:NAD(P)H-nitrite reductase large subunit